MIFGENLILSFLDKICKSSSLYKTFNKVKLHFKIWSLIVFLGITAYAAGDPVNVTKIPRLDGRIVGGEPADIRDFPHQISLRLSGSHICGGSIIGNATVLTAAHCVDTSKPHTSYSVKAGVTNRLLAGQIRYISNIRVHKKYNDETYDYDVAVLTVSEDFDFSESVRIIELQEKAVAAGTITTVTGWGVTAENSQVVPNGLKKVDLQIISNSACSESYKNVNSITSRMLCAGVPGGGKDACQGDSGGPLISNGKQIGIVSWGMGCARPEYPGAYANVAELRDWIINSATRTPPVNLFTLSFVAILTVHKFF